MRTFTLKMYTCLCVCLAMLFVSLPSMAQKGTDFFGQWKFTAKLELTDAGQQHAELFKSECDVTIEKHSIYDMAIIGVGGGTAKQMVNSIGTNTLTINNPNGSNTVLWGKVAMANANGDYPFGSFTIEYAFSSDYKTITIPDFTAVTYNHDDASAEVLARFTDCKLTLVAREEIKVDDMSGDYHFTASSMTMEGSEFPTEFDMNLKATNEGFTAYTATITFPGYPSVVIENATFDGNELAIPYNETYIDEAKTIVFTGAWDSSVTGAMKFTKTGANSFSLPGGVGFAEKIVEGEANWKRIQYYLGGTAIRAAKDVDFVGTYTVTAETVEALLTDFEYPKTFDFEITLNANNGKYYMTKFMGNDIFKLTYGSAGVLCEVEGNVLKISVSSASIYYNVRLHYDSGDGSKKSHDCLFDGMGEMVNPIKVTQDGDGNLTMDDFSLSRRTMTLDISDIWANPEYTIEPAAYYMGLKIVKKSGDSVAEVEAGNDNAGVYVENGIIRVKGGEKAFLQVFNTAGQMVYSGETAQVAGLAKGLYIVKNGAATVKVAL